MINPKDSTFINGINVYDINNIAIMKANAYANRDKIRDLYDLTFIVNNWFGELNEYVKNIVQNALAQKGIEQFDFIVKEQSDDLINNDELMISMLNAFDKLDILSSKDESNSFISIYFF